MIRKVLSASLYRCMRLRKRVDAYLRHCFRERRSPHLGELSQELGMRQDILSKTFRKLNGCTLSSYVKDQQIARAVSLLEQTKMTVDEIAKRSGFEHPRSFYRLFRQKKGDSPSKIRGKKCP
jgi:AraC-like DNA-binding protein